MTSTPLDARWRTPGTLEHRRYYNVWRSMHLRCTNKKREGYHRYGGRGITVCPEWEEFWTFAFDMGPRPPGTSLDRINNDGNYEPSNCRWATPEQQQANTANTKLITFEGVSLPTIGWARRVGISNAGMKYRVRKFGFAEAVRMGPSNPMQREKGKFVYRAGERNE